MRAATGTSARSTIDTVSRCRGFSSRQEVQDKLAGELRAGVTACNEEITVFIKPLEAATAAEVARVEKAEADRSALLKRLGDLKMQAANVE